LNVCPNPLDPIDIEALASGSGDLLPAAAREHAAGCAACAEAVRQSERLEAFLQPEPDAVPAELVERVLRVRPFSRAERLSLAVWKTPLLLFAALGIAGTALVAGVAPGRDQIGLAAAAAAALTGLARATLRWLADLARTAPSGLDALSHLLRPTSLGWAALLLLAPLFLGLRRVLARSFARR
jgi:hypothetical protein